MDTQGWIKLFRKITSWEWYQDSHMVHLMLHLSMSAEHHERKVRGKTVKRGQVLTSRERLKADTGISEQTIRTCLKRLVECQSLTIESTKQGMLITVLNYETYQATEAESNQQSNRQVTSQLTSQLTNPIIYKEERRKKDNNKLLSKEQQQQQNVREEEGGRRLANAWNITIDKYKEKGYKVVLKKVIKITKRRLSILQDAYERLSHEELIRILHNVITSDYCNGRKKERLSKPADIEWVFEDPDRTVRILEGKYN